MFDEIKLKSGIAFNAKNGSVTGFVSNRHGSFCLNNALKNLLAETPKTMAPNKEFTKFCTPTSQTSTIEYARSTEPCNVSQIGNGDKKDSNFDDVQKRVATYVHLFRVQLLNGLSRNVERRS